MRRDHNFALTVWGGGTNLRKENNFTAKSRYEKKGWRRRGG
jgi:hypothetical protein